MSHVLGPDECECSGHLNNGHCYHSIPCCDGKCSQCGNYIKRGMMRAHVNNHREERARQAAASKSRKAQGRLLSPEEAEKVRTRLGF